MEEAEAMPKMQDVIPLVEREAINLLGQNRFSYCVSIALFVLSLVWLVWYEGMIILSLHAFACSWLTPSSFWSIWLRFGDPRFPTTVQIAKRWAMLRQLLKKLQQRQQAEELKQRRKHEE